MSALGMTYRGSASGALLAGAVIAGRPLDRNAIVGRAGAGGRRDAEVDPGTGGAATLGGCVPTSTTKESCAC